MSVFLLIIISIILVFLILEKMGLNRRIHTIPLRITVTGTRGKSGVVRMITSVLREDGKKVLGKITGSCASYLLPGDEESPINRRGPASILEQKNTIKKASELNADCLVCEIMSIHAENHVVESQKLLYPHMVVVTNVRLDHVDAMGGTLDEIAEVLCLDIPKKAVVFVHAKEIRPVFETCVVKQGGTCVIVPSNSSKSITQAYPGLIQNQFEENLDLVVGVCSYLKIDTQTIARGLQKTGESESFEIKTIEKNDKKLICVDAFGANDPESTFRFMEKVRGRLPAHHGALAGILSLRSDRGDRTMQWIRALKDEKNNPFGHVFILGAHGRAVQRFLKQSCLISEKRPEGIMESILNVLEGGSVLVGLGNKKGLGEDLVRYWGKVGDHVRV